MLESKIEKFVKQYAKKNNWLVYKWQSATTKGVPDDIFIKNGVILFIEFKSSSGRTQLTPLQKLVHNDLKNQNVEVHVISDITEGIRLLNSKDLLKDETTIFNV